MLRCSVVNGFVNETRRNGGDGGETRRDGWDGRLIVACAFETWEATGDGDGLAITQRSRIRILSSLPAETRPAGFAPGGCHAAREHGSTCQLSALPHGEAALSMTSANDGLHVWLPEALGPLIRASFVRTLRSRTQRKPVRFTSNAATTRMRRRSRSNVLHSAHGCAYAAGQQHSLPPHTRKVTGSIPVGTITSFLQVKRLGVGLL